MRKLISLLLIQFFLVQISIASSPNAFAGRFHLPWHVAMMDATYEAPPPSGPRASHPHAGKRIILIQDAHTNESAQINVARSLEILLREMPGLDTVFLEGGTGNESLSFLRQLSPEERRKEVGSAFLQAGRLQGSEYFDLTSREKLTLWGVEDMALYRQSLELYRAVMGERGLFEAYLDHLSQTIERLKPAVYRPALLRFDARREAYRNEKLGIMDFLGFLIGEARKLGIALNHYPQMATLTRVLDGGLGLSDLVESRVIDPKRLFREIRTLSDAIYRQHALTRREQRLVRASRSIGLLKALVELKLDPDRYASYRAQRAALDVDYISGFLNTLIVDLEGRYDRRLVPPEGFDALIRRCEAFYVLAFERDGAFLDAMFRKMDEENRSEGVLIVGGFHAAHLKRLMRRQGVSYISLMPMVTHPTDRERYERILLNQKMSLMPLRMWSSGRIYGLAMALGVSSHRVGQEAPRHTAPLLPQRQNVPLPPIAPSLAR